MIDGCRQVFLLLQKHIQFGLALSDMVGRRVLTLCLLTHVVNLQGKNGQAVYRPGRTLGIDGGGRGYLHVLKLIAEVTVYLFYQIRAVLVALVDTSLEQEGFVGVDLRIADNILEMPLYGVYPTFEI